MSAATMIGIFEKRMKGRIDADCVIKANGWLIRETRRMVISENHLAYDAMAAQWLADLTASLTSTIAAKSSDKAKDNVESLQRAARIEVISSNVRKDRQEQVAKAA